MQLIDSHSHIDFPAFNKDLPIVLKKAKQAGVDKIVVSATIAERWPVIRELVKGNPQCHAAYGLHPMFMSDYSPQQLDTLKTWLEKEKPIALGEIGLDYFISLEDGDNSKADQLALFISQLELADEFKLPVIIHARKSLDLILKQLRLFPHLQGSIHSFSGSEQQAKQLIDLGFYLGFGGPITYTRATRLRKLVNTLPLESLLLETDSPDQPDALHFGERNEPAYLPIIAQTIADIRGLAVETVAEVTTKNAHTLFRFNKS